MHSEVSDSSHTSSQSFSSFKKRFGRGGIKAATTISQAEQLRSDKIRRREDKRWKDKYQKYYKDNKRFNLDLIRRHSVPFKFKIQFLYPRPKKGQPEPPVPAAHRVREYLTSTAFSLTKVKIVQMKEEHKAKVFATVLDRQAAVSVYDFFFKGRGPGFKSSVYFIHNEEILKEHTLQEIERHEKKKREKRDQDKINRILEEQEEEEAKPLEFSMVEKSVNLSGISPKPKKKKRRRRRKKKREEMKVEEAESGAETDQEPVP